MNKQKTPATVLLVLLAGIAISCTKPIEENVAVFEDFNYEGHDSFYQASPLPNESSFYNPIIAGWCSDPSICSNGKGDYYLVSSTFSYFPGVPIYHSSDLMNWKQISNVLNRESQLNNLVGAGLTIGGIYAPDIQYNPHNDTYYMITTNLKGRYGEGNKGNFLVKTKNPVGEWSEIIEFPEMEGIDPSLFFDEDGKAYIVNSGYPPVAEYPGHMAVHLCEYDVEKDVIVPGSDRIILDKGSRPELKPESIEGPHLYKFNGKYYLMCAEGGTGSNHSEVIMRSDNIYGPYIPWEKNPILTQRTLDKRSNPVTSTGHADLVMDANGKWWGVFLGCRPIDGEFQNLGRETFLMPLRWSDDGYPYFIEDGEEIPLIGQMEGVKRGDEVTFGNFTIKDEFDTPELKPDWMTVRGTAKEYYTLENGTLKLLCAPVKTTGLENPAIIVRRLHHHAFTATTHMRFNPANAEAMAGMILLGDETHQYLMGVTRGDDGNPRIFLQKTDDGVIDELASVSLPIGSEDFQLKIESSGKGFAFFYGLKGKDWQLLADHVSAKYLTEMFASFSGTTMGVFATSKQEPGESVLHMLLGK